MVRCVVRDTIDLRGVALILMTPTPSPISVSSDEPAVADSLNRQVFAQAFARLAETCETPFVIGLYGSWGIGKTTLMRMIERELDSKLAIAVRFNLWQHQFDQSPVIALAQTLGTVAGGSQVKAIKKLLFTVATAYSGMLLNRTTGLSMSDLLMLGTKYEEERFEVREAQLRLHEHLGELVAAVRRGKEGERRLVFFIDDVDRCLPKETLQLLESLKLHLNVEGCVYFLAVDRQALEAGIRAQYSGQAISDAEYLDKIIQLPFTVPTIEPSAIGEFVARLLPPDLRTCIGLLVAGIGDNPRQVKRFINTLMFSHHLARSFRIPRYDPRLLALFLLIQEVNPAAYRALIPRIQESGTLEAAQIKEVCEGEPRLARALAALARDAFDGVVLKNYVYLTKNNIGAAIDLDVPTASVSVASPLRGRYVLWVDDEGVVGTEAIEQSLQNKGVALSVVTTSEDAMERIRTRIPDLIVSDIGRGEDHDAGFEMAKQIRADSQYRGPIYFFAGDNGHGRIAKAQAVGGMIFLERAPLLKEIEEFMCLYRPGDSTPPMN